MNELIDWITESDNIVFFGGAGVSSESGIPDFRSNNGIYQKIEKYGGHPEEIISHTYFLKHPDIFYKFYIEEMIYPHAKPNPAHKALSVLEDMGKLRAVITQNIDNLHQKAGSKEVLELHGSVERNNCMTCKHFYTLEEVLKRCKENYGIPVCDCGGLIKPDVVLYEEPLNPEVLEKSIAYILDADVLIIGGTSLTVYPAANLINYYNGEKLVLINHTPTPYDNRANLIISQDIGVTLDNIIKKI